MAHQIHQYSFTFGTTRINPGQRAGLPVRCDPAALGGERGPHADGGAPAVVRRGCAAQGRQAVSTGAICADYFCLLNKV